MFHFIKEQTTQMERFHVFFFKLLVQSLTMESLIGHLGQDYFSSALPKSQTQQTERLDPTHVASPETARFRGGGSRGTHAGHQQAHTISHMAAPILALPPFLPDSFLPSSPSFSPQASSKHGDHM